MTKSAFFYHSFGGSGAGGSGVGFGGWLGVKAFSGTCCVPFMAKSPNSVFLMPIRGSFDCVLGAAAGFGAKLWAGVWPVKFSLACCLVATKDCVGVFCVRVMRTTGAVLGALEAGLFDGVFI